MGLFDAIKGIGGIPGLGIAYGKNPITKALGLDGAQGDYFEASNGNQALADIMARDAISGNAGVNSGIANYGQGKVDLATALKSGGLSGVQQAELRNLIASDPLSGSRFASDQVMADPNGARMFGTGDSALSRALAEDKQLAQQGYQLNQDDHTAYGQISGDIARMFGNQENQTARSLASRGLAAAPSGAAGAAFSGLAGNKNEQLAKAQMDIASQRFDRTMQRRQQLANTQTDLNGQYQGAVQNQFGRQMAGVQQSRNNLENAAGLQTDQNKAANAANLDSNVDKRGAKGKTLLQGFGTGLFGSAVAAGNVPGKMASSQAGGGMA